MLRNTTRRDKHRRLVRKGEPPCHICGEPIDYQAPHRDPLSFTIDHITPLNRGGTDTLDNLAAAHWACNCNKQDSLPMPAGVRFITDRAW